ncbi:hypothetical protein [Salegentibacter lacus]|nr:hypothetical protein [Salegentibacter lacus]
MARRSVVWEIKSKDLDKPLPEILMRAGRKGSQYFLIDRNIRK